MLVPEAPPDVDDFPPTREDDVGSARQVVALEPETVAQAVEQAPDGHFGLGVPALHGREVPAPALGDVGEVWPLLAMAIFGWHGVGHD